MDLFSPLQPWLDRKAHEPPFRDITDLELDADTGCAVILDGWVPIHEALSLQPQSLSLSWHSQRAYVKAACEVILAESPLALDREEPGMITRKLGPPPKQAYPLYFITTKRADEDEKIVYIGKTSSKSSRFVGGHAAITKLHAPQFDGVEKRLHLGCVTFVDKEWEYVPLEMVQPLVSAKKLLSDLEMQLIYHFQPVLNRAGKTTRLSKLEQIIHVQGITQGGKDYWLYPGETYAHDR